ncbi:anosmin-1 [Zophobas morio]|uniref:anosmin-1 n=1 Tax=Zophobas morio TaxID=2755281 RepID=UPI003083CB73
MTAVVFLQRIFLLLVCVLCGLVDAFKTRSQYGQYDALLVARCEARCWFTPDKNSCLKHCLLQPLDKPGLCPKSDTVLTPFDAVCLDTCHQDSQCFALTKCCRHSCGITCQNPVELSTAKGVPDVPQDVKVTGGPKKKTVFLEWTSQIFAAPNSTTLFVIEERHHTGHNFIEKHLSDWSFCGRSPRPSQILKTIVKPGRWYQFRVAAVNENGTKGFSDTSPVFNIAVRPRPPKPPQNVTVSGLWSTSNGTLMGELRWSPPRSDLPIQRYKVFWSRRLHGAKPLDSVLVHQQVVPKEQTRFLLQDLQPNSLYFLQIQALVQYGKKRLKSQKSALILNTTDYISAPPTPTPPIYKTRNKIEGLRVQKMYWSSEGLRAKVIWKSKDEPQKYTVNLWTGPCFKGSKSRRNFKLTVTTQVSHFDLYDLHFSCKYRVGVRSVPDEDVASLEDSFITFVTPNCNEFKRTNRKTRCTD